MLNDMFVLMVPLAEKVLRPVIVYLALVVLLRIFGKRELAQLNPFDLVVLLSLSNTVQNAIIGNDNSVSGGLVGAFTLLAANYLVVRFLFKHRRLDQLVEGKSTTLIDRGKIQHKNLAKELLSHSELLTVGAPPGKFRLKNLSGVDLTAITACYYSISADADKNNDQIISGDEGAPYDNFGTFLPNTAYQLLGNTREVPITRVPDPPVNRYTYVHELPYTPAGFRVNDIIVTVPSARYSPFKELLMRNGPNTGTNGGANHNHVKDPISASRTLEGIRAAEAGKCLAP